ncbi:phospholipid phosphatase-related protein type 1-like [Tachypleus tridentatus]|uniref:phospholipid phosphatase-related protein type 1-like n=1 Tax=Tachypleus tridentatus TaxID=6853 RepID=UPI003FD58EFB
MTGSQRSQFSTMRRGSYNSSTIYENFRQNNLLEPIPVDNQSSSSDDESETKVNISLIPVFISEIIFLGCVAVLAYFLRFETVFPVFDHEIFVNDTRLMYPKEPSYHNSTVPVNFSEKTLYALFLGIPLGFILLGEVGYFTFSRRSKKVVSLGCQGCKLHVFTRRLLRFTGTFLFGLLCTSILTDSLKIVTGRPRPYFLEACNMNKDVVSSDRLFSSSCSASGDLREARTSFPSFYASLSAYTGVFVMSYVHCVLAIRASRLLRPFLVLSIGSFFMLCGTSRVALHKNHLEDIAVGWCLGGAVAVYLCIFTLESFREHHQLKRKCYHSKKHIGFFPIKQKRPLFFRYFRIPHISYQNSQTQRLSNADLSTNYSLTSIPRTQSFPPGVLNG